MNPEARRCLSSLTPRLAQFCLEYVVDYNGAQAAKRAGYAARTAAIMANKLLRMPAIQTALAAMVRPRLIETELTGRQVTREIVPIIQSTILDFIDDEGRLKNPREWDPIAAKAIASYDFRKKTIAFHPKVPALALAAKITRLVEQDQYNLQIANQYVVMCPADATPEQWEQMVESHYASLPPPTSAGAATVDVEPIPGASL